MAENTEVAQMADEEMRTVDVGEIVFLVFGLCGHVIFSASDPDIHRAFRAIHICLPTLFGSEVAFDTNGNYAFSEQIIDAIWQLTFSGMLDDKKSDDIGVWYCKPADGLIDLTISEVQNRNPEKMRLIRQAAERFGKIIPIHP